ncbi:MAG: hypothetical protein KDK51_07905 [Deltaproteobacteria bacterium]|nr:hypothetical protein [Deltaproteobacteria bacterium]
MYKTQLFLLSFFLFIATGSTELVYANQDLVKCDLEIAFLRVASGGGNTKIYNRSKKVSLTKAPGSNQIYLVTELSTHINDNPTSAVINKNGSYLVFDIIGRSTDESVLINAYAVTDPTPVTTTYDGHKLVKDYGYKKIPGFAYTGSIRYGEPKILHSEKGYPYNGIKLITSDNLGFHIKSITADCNPTD